MKCDSRILQEDEMDLREIIKILWNEKMLILSISLFFMVIALAFGLFLSFIIVFLKSIFQKKYL